MKLTFVIGNMSNGGAQRVMSILCNELALLGHQVSLVLFNRSEVEYPISDKVNLISLCDDYETYRSLNFISRISRIRKILKQTCPDVAVGFTQGGNALFLSSFGLKFPKVASARISPHMILGKKGFRGFLNRLWFKKADAVVIQTESQIKEIPSGLWKNTVVISNPIPFALYEGQKAEQQKSVPNEIIMVGRIEEQKNYPMAIEAMRIISRSHPDVRLRIFGKGSKESYIRDLIRQYDLESNITLEGWTQNVSSELLGSDIYIMTSNCEGMPNSLMEAMAQGLLCVSTDCKTGPSDLIRHGENGFLVPVNDVDSLVQTITELLSMNAEERNRMCASARRSIIDRFSSRTIVKKWEALFASLLTCAGKHT